MAGREGISIRTGRFACTGPGDLENLLRDHRRGEDHQHGDDENQEELFRVLLVLSPPYPEDVEERHPGSNAHPELGRTDNRNPVPGVQVESHIHLEEDILMKIFEKAGDILGRERGHRHEVVLRIPFRSFNSGEGEMEGLDEFSPFLIRDFSEDMHVGGVDMDPDALGKVLDGVLDFLLKFPLPLFQERLVPVNAAIEMVPPHTTTWLPSLK